MRIFILVFLSYSSQLFAQPVIDVQHYRFELKLTDASDTLYGTTTVDFVARQVIQQVTLDLKGETKKGMRVLNVQTRDSLPLMFEQQDDKLHISLLKKANAGDTVGVRIHYRGVPDDGLIISKNKFGERTFFADNWPNRAHHWLPVVDHPADKASFEFLVTAPAHYDVISNGVKLEENSNGHTKMTHWREDVPLSTKIMVIGVARFAVKNYSGSPPHVPVSAWVYPPDSSRGFTDFSVAPHMLQFFSDYIGPYAFQKLANVQSTTIFGGMENASAIFYDEKGITGKKENEGTVAHEIVHQWFGNMASEKSFAHLWLSEGFATYLTHVYYEEKSGVATMQERLRSDRQKVIAFAHKKSMPVVDSTSALMDLLNANSYQKGGWVLHMLRQEVGDDDFQAIIRSYYQQYKGGNADTRDFQRVAEEISGMDLAWFFDQWLYRPGVPVLTVNWKMDGKKLNIHLRQSGAHIYRLPVEIGILTADGRQTIQTIVLDTTSKEVGFDLPAKPVKLVLDPDVKLLFEEGN